jgi:hypothetical protein
MPLMERNRYCTTWLHAIWVSALLLTTFWSEKCDGFLTTRPLVSSSLAEANFSPLILRSESSPRKKRLRRKKSFSDDEKISPSSSTTSSSPTPTKTNPAETSIQTNAIEATTTAATATQSSSLPPLKSRQKAATIPIRNVRDLAESTPTVSLKNDVKGSVESALNIPRPLSSQPKFKSQEEKEEDDDDDPLAQILKDAKQMQALERRNKQGAEDSVIEQDNDGNLDFRNIVSTIVTIDFFVVCALLVWFLAGVVSSSIFKNDDIQIAFNGIFQPVVQPALGILMIAAISDAVLNKLNNNKKSNDS